MTCSASILCLGIWQLLCNPCVLIGLEPKSVVSGYIDTTSLHLSLQIALAIFEQGNTSTSHCIASRQHYQAAKRRFKPPGLRIRVTLENSVAVYVCFILCDDTE